MTGYCHCQWAVRIAVFATCAVSSGFGTGQTSRYRLILHSAHLEKSNPAYFGSGGFYRVDRNPDNNTVLNGFFPILQDLPADTMLTWIGYIKSKNKWKDTLVRGDKRLCEILESTIPMFRGIYDSSNFPTICPVTKGNYTIKEFSYDKIELPPAGVVPNSHYRVLTSYISGKTTLCATSIEIKVAGKANNARG